MRNLKVGDIIERKPDSIISQHNDLSRIKSAIIIEKDYDYHNIMRIRAIYCKNLCGIGRTFCASLRDIETYFQIATPSNKMVKCASCGQIVNKDTSIHSSSGGYICLNCATFSYRGFLNNERFHKPTSTNKTYGFELECYPHSVNDYASMLYSKYHLLPTSDCTLKNGGVELKTPTFYGLSGLRMMFKSLSKYMSCVDRSCGQHINIGDTEWINPETMDKLRRYGPRCFEILSVYMEKHQNETIKVCGRYFTDWAEPHNPYNNHSSWISLRHPDRVEFRLSKFRDYNQYFDLTCMWTEILDCAINNIIKHEQIEDAHHIGEMMIQIFQKYVDQKARCQKIA